MDKLLLHLAVSGTISGCLTFIRFTISFYAIYRLLRLIRHRIAYRDFYRLPVLGERDGTDLRAAMEEGTRKFPDRPFVLSLLDPTVILPHHVIDEVKSLPETRVSIEANNHRRFFGEYTLMGAKSDELVASVKQNLTRNVGALIPELIEEIAHATPTVIDVSPRSPSVTLPVYNTMLRYIALLTGRTVVGLPLSRSEEWVSSSINYAVESMEAGHQLRAYPASIRKWLGPFLPRVRKVKEHQLRICRMLEGLLVEQQRSFNPKESLDNERGRLASWLLQHYDSPSEVPVQVLCKDHILALFAGIHIATNAVTQVLIDLAARPEYQTPLLEEIESVLGKADERRDTTLADIARMSKLDSFIKESLYVNPPGGVVTLMRETTAPLRPSCGPLLPKGTLIAFANNRFDMSTVPSHNPDDFDGFRHARLRNAGTGESKYQLLTPSSESLTWGYGIHACPGRLFAATEIKLIVIHLLTRFQLRLGSHRNRPPSSSYDFQIMPDPKAQITFTSRLAQKDP
ncbi:cytochrome P450 [Aspergillus udagawae]|uniref:Ent-kaurene oxidase n=1 Tax=Aspergillus udagawae TaxID=91492 RepID=A0A8E0UYM0_9EURO|nr:uncharacterized protein Aud_003890 [Aspergillus udagawae]GIC87506.1 hypothetical protein Aud_003890 [Aspergillus udagawae]